MPWQALPVPEFQPLIPTRFLVAGDGFSPEALRTAADEGQRANLSRVLGRPVTVAALAAPATVTTWTEHRARLGRGGVNGVLDFTYTSGAAGRPCSPCWRSPSPSSRTRRAAAARSRLRTMGLSPRQGRRLLVYELVPLVAGAFVTGGLVGVLLPRLLGPALGLGGFSTGVTGEIRVHPWLPVAAVLLLATALAVGTVVESAANRRLRLGELLRL